MFGVGTKPVGRGNFVPLNTQESVDSLHLDSGSSDTCMRNDAHPDNNRNEWDDSPTKDTIPTPVGNFESLIKFHYDS